MSVGDGGSASPIIIQPQPERRLKRTDDIAERIKGLIVEKTLKPGDRLPNERELIDLFHASKSTVREALKGLEAQGLIRSRTGPGGGTFVAQLSGSRAMELLGNYFFFRQPSIGDIYAVRIELEPELSASVIGHLSDEDFETLQRTMRLYERPPRDRGEEYQQRLAELDFHSVLAELCPNPILGFVCGFMHNLLRNLTICRHIYEFAQPAAARAGAALSDPPDPGAEGRGRGSGARDHARPHGDGAALHGGIGSDLHRRLPAPRPGPVRPLSGSFRIPCRVRRPRRAHPSPSRPRRG